jgi:hypothetical protein
MRRKAQNRLWTLILMLLLSGASLAPAVRVARADVSPTDPTPGAPPGDPQAGDPDSPDTGRSLPAPGAHRGNAGQAIRVTAAPWQSGWGIWLLRLRMAFASVYHFVFRI